MKCPYCGAEIPQGESCTCRDCMIAEAANIIKSLTDEQVERIMSDFAKGV